MLTIEVDQEEDGKWIGKWIGEVTALPGVLVYGATEVEAKSNAAALALQVIADRTEQGSQYQMRRARDSSGKPQAMRTLRGA